MIQYVTFVLIVSLLSKEVLFSPFSVCWLQDYA